jgi:hypothetical protein
MFCRLTAEHELPRSLALTLLLLTQWSGHAQLDLSHRLQLSCVTQSPLFPSASLMASLALICTTTMMCVLTQT